MTHTVQPQHAWHVAQYYGLKARDGDREHLATAKTYRIASRDLSERIAAAS